jgi:hypothetical protein
VRWRFLTLRVISQEALVVSAPQLEQVKKMSLKGGHLKGLEKEAALKRIFGITTKATILK